MMDDLDRLLARVAAEPVHPGLADMEGQVFARIGERRQGSGLGIGVAIVAGALGMGVMGAGMPAGTVQASPPLAPLGANTPLAPSTLLVGDQ